MIRSLKQFVKHCGDCVIALVRVAAGHWWLLIADGWRRMNSEEYRAIGPRIHIPLFKAKRDILECPNAISKNS